MAKRCAPVTISIARGRRMLRDVAGCGALAAVAATAVPAAAAQVMLRARQ